MLQIQGERGVASVPENWWYSMLLDSCKLSYSMQRWGALGWRRNRGVGVGGAPSRAGQNVGLKLVLSVLAWHV